LKVLKAADGCGKLDVKRRDEILPNGQTLSSPYRIVCELIEGGVGAVY
jgi:hypothetical protein